MIFIEFGKKRLVFFNIPKINYIYEKSIKDMTITESQLKSIISNAANKAASKISDFMTGRPYPEGKPKRIIDVINADGWGLNREKLDKYTFSISPKVIGLLSNPLPIDELVEDINIYLEDSGSKYVCSGWQEEDDDISAYIRFSPRNKAV